MTENVEGLDDFDKAFAEVAASAEKTPEQAAADEAAAAAAAAKTPEQIAAEAKAAEDAAAKAAADAKAAEDAAEAAAAKTPEQIAAEAKAAEDAAAAAAKATADAAAAAEAEKVAAAARAQAAVETPEAKAAREALEASIKPYEPTEEEKAALATFEKEFPNEYKAMQARLKGVDKDINARVYAAVQGVLKDVAPRVAAVEAAVSTSEADRHFAALHTAHPDYDAVIVKVPEWIKTLPSYARAGAQAVYDGGTTQEVAALVADYKKAAGITVVDPAAAAEGAAAADAGDLEPVSSRRSTPSQRGAPDKNNYDAAWTELEAATK